MGVRWLDEVWVERRVDRAEGAGGGGGEVGTRESVVVVVVVVDILTDKWVSKNGNWR